MLAQCGKDRGDGGPSFRVDRHAPGRVGDCARSRSHHLVCPDHYPRCPNGTELPNARNERGDDRFRFDEYRHSGRWSDKSPARVGIGCDMIREARPSARRRRTQKVACAARRIGRRIVHRSVFDRGRHQAIQNLQRFVVEYFLLGLPRYFSTVPICTEIASRCQQKYSR